LAPIQLHDSRHSAATRMARQGMPLVGIQATLGHTNLTTTQGYIAGSGPHLREWAQKTPLPELVPHTAPNTAGRGK
jgi:site-specific recombinase XerD